MHSNVKKELILFQEKTLRKKLLVSLKEQGFASGLHLKSMDNSKKELRSLHVRRRSEMLRLHSNFLTEFRNTAMEYAINGNEIDPSNIQLEIRYVESDSFEARLFLWWNLIWWSIPYERPVGRQMRFILWDKGHDAPFGLIGLQSAPLKMAVRDRYLQIPNHELDYWLNMSLHGQRVGALPPYNDLLGGKLVSLALTSNEIRKKYSEKYEKRITLIKNRKIPANLFFITTTGAFGRSSVYERLRYRGEKIGEFLGFTAGSGTFYVNDLLYLELLQYLSSLGYDTKRGIKIGPSRKLQFIHNALANLGIKRSARKTVQRGVYLFSNVSNLKQIIGGNSKPLWVDRPFYKIQDYWVKQYCIPRSERTQSFRKFDSDQFFNNLKQEFTN